MLPSLKCRPRPFGTGSSESACVFARRTCQPGESTTYAMELDDRVFINAINIGQDWSNQIKWRWVEFLVISRICGDIALTRTYGVLLRWSTVEDHWGRSPQVRVRLMSPWVQQILLDTIQRSLTNLYSADQSRSRSIAFTKIRTQHPGSVCEVTASCCDFVGIQEVEQRSVRPVVIEAVNLHKSERAEAQKWTRSQIVTSSERSRSHIRRSRAIAL